MTNGQEVALRYIGLFISCGIVRLVGNWLGLLSPWTLREYFLVPLLATVVWTWWDCRKLKKQ